MRNVDCSYETDLDKLAAIAQKLAEDIREMDPQRVFRECERLAKWHPTRAAQLLMCLATFVNPDESLGQRVTRVDAIVLDRAVDAKVGA